MNFTSTHSDIVGPVSDATPSGRAAPTRARLKILLAEDDADMRGLLETELRRDGHDVTAVADGVAAMKTLNLLRRYPDAMFDVLVMDVRMPRGSGLEVAFAVRQFAWSTHVILITGFGDPALHRDAASIGATVFDKPFDLDDLRTALANLDLLPSPSKPHRDP